MGHRRHVVGGIVPIGIGLAGVTLAGIVLQCLMGQRNRWANKTKHFPHVNLNSSVSILRQILKYTPLVSL